MTLESSRSSFVECFQKRVHAKSFAGHSLGFVACSTSLHGAYQWRCLLGIDTWFYEYNYNLLTLTCALYNTKSVYEGAWSYLAMHVAIYKGCPKQRVKIQNNVQAPTEVAIEEL